MDKVDIAIWMRNYGIDDEDTFSAGELEEILEDFYVDITPVKNVHKNADTGSDNS